MLINSIAFSSGIILLYFWGRLPDPDYYPLLLTISFFAFLFRFTRPPGFFLLGVLYAATQAENQIADQVKPSSGSQTLVLQGHVCSLPVYRADRVVFDFCDVTGIDSGKAGPVTRFSKLRLSLYLNYDSAENRNNHLAGRERMPALQGVLRLSARVKPPNGVVNKHGFLYESWLFAHGYSGTGYVLSVSPGAESACGLLCRYRVERIRLVNHFSRFQNREPESCEQNTGSCEESRDAYENGKDSFQFFHSVVLGNKSAIAPETKSLFNDTGTGHLLVISGLHAGFVGVLAFKLLSVIFAWLFPRHKSGARQAAGLVAILPVFAYIAVAGFTVPATRAFLMFMFGSLMLVVLRRPVIWVFCVTFAIMLVINPASVLDGGFWLSFYAVFILLLVHGARPITSPLVFRLLKPHVALFLGLAPLMVFMGMNVSLVSVLANLLVVPFFGLVMLPLGFFAAVAGFIDNFACDLCLSLFSVGYRLITGYLSYLLQFDLFLSVTGSPGPLLLALTLVMVLCLILPLPLKLRCTLASVLLAFCSYPIEYDRRRYGITVYDVGQGLSVELQADNINMVYDFGMRYSDTFDMAGLVLLPNMKVRGVRDLDFGVISHWDLDHSGGWHTFATGIPVDILLSPESPLPGVNELRSGETGLSRLSEYCHSGAQYSKNQFTMRVLWPEPGMRSTGIKASDNNASCVIRVEFAGISVLMPGDIEKEVEYHLVEKYGNELRSDVLIVAHHGSQTSSTWAFLKHVRPKIALISSGYGNKFAHPHRDVLQRLKYFGVTTYNTAESGAIHLYRDGADASSWRVQEMRKICNKFWLRG